MEVDVSIAGRLYLLDISHFTFRAYHALPQLNTSQGLATNAVHGVASMLERLIREQRPAFIAAAFDTGAKTFRNELFPAYKANREEPDEDLKVQFPLVRRLVDAMAIHCVEKEGFEADDLMATLARRFSQAGREVVIVSGDKDLMQCVDSNVVLLDPVKGRWVRRPEVEQKFGVGPQAVTDVQALMGDSSDNIPGIRGIGPKTAAVLIGHFGSLEKMLERSSEIENLELRGAKGVRERVEAEADSAMLFKRLATLRDDLDLDTTIEDMALRSTHTSELLSLAEELEMGRLAGRIRRVASEQVDENGGNDPGGGPPGEESFPEQVNSSATGARPQEKAKGGAQWRTMVGAEVAVAFGHDDFERPVLELGQGEKYATVVGEDGVRECLGALAVAGTSLCGFELKTLCRLFGAGTGDGGMDLGLASYLYDPSAGGHGPSEVAERFLGRASAASLSFEGGVGVREVRELIPVMRRALEEHGQADLYRSLEHPLIGILAAMENKGILLDCGLLGDMSGQFDARMTGLVADIYESAGKEFNILSPLQLREVLYDRLKLPTRGVKKTKTGFSTDSDTLEALSAHHPLPARVLEYRGLAKLKSTYIDALPRLVDEEGRVHTTFNQAVTATGRLSSSDPNLQNIPVRTREGARIREAFIAPRGAALVSADYNQIELRVLAHLSQDEALKAAFHEGRDVHAATSAELFGVAEEKVTNEQRRRAKVINYGIIYGMGPVRMSRELGMGRKQATEFIARYFERYPGVQAFFSNTLDGARAKGYVSTLFGRRRYLPAINSGNGGMRQAAERVATNTPIQGTAADIIKSAMVALAARLDAAGLDAAMVLQIHDELLLECPKSETKRVVELAVETMGGAASLAIPLVVDVGNGKNWAQAH